MGEGDPTADPGRDRDLGFPDDPSLGFPDEPPGPRRLTRRQALILGGVGGAATLGGAYLLRDARHDGAPAGDSAAPARPEPHADHDGAASTVPQPEEPVVVSEDLPAARWTDPATWGGQVPGPGDVAVVTQPVLLDTDAEVAGVQIEPAGDLWFDPGNSRTLHATGNVVVSGRLRMRPAAASLVHTVQFDGVDESRFEGGHSDGPLEGDVGLWVVGNGLLDVAGTAKTAWTNATGALAQGDRSVTVADAAGWRVGDEIVVTPTEPTTVGGHWEHHDRRTITSVDGVRIGLDRGLEFDHPVATVRPGVTHTAEVLNLTRNALIQGTPEGRSHVIMLSAAQPQHIAHLGLRHMGPRQGDNEVLGRYAIHFHTNYDASQGSTVEGVVAYDSTGHAFAAHLSNGVSFRDCVAHDMVDDAFWWDLSIDGGGRDLVPSNQIVYERCVAHFVKSGGNSKFNLTGFLMGAGNGNVARGCVATGIQGGAESSAGFHWPSHSRNDEVWTFEDNLAHNNRHSGIYFWQNGVPRTIVDRFTAYHCGQGIFAGSYSNLVSYRDCTLYANETSGLIISALPSREGRRSGETITYENMYIDQAGLSEYAVDITKHLARGASDRVTVIMGGVFKGGNRAQVGLPQGGDHPQLYDFVDVTFEGNAFWLADDLPADTHLRVDGPDGSFTVRPSHQPGEPRPAWNATIESG
jgi:G8 domain